MRRGFTIKKKLLRLFLLSLTVCISALTMSGMLSAKEVEAMESRYFLKVVRICGRDAEDENLAYDVEEGDVILDKWSSFQVLPAAMDAAVPITRFSERLLRIKELREEVAVVAVLRQDFDPATNMREVTEKEELKEVKYGQTIYVYAKDKYQPRDGGPFSTISYTFAILDKANPGQQIFDEPMPWQQMAQNFCHHCMAMWVKGDKFCRNCGKPRPQ